MSAEREREKEHPAAPDGATTPPKLSGGAGGEPRPEHAPRQDRTPPRPARGARAQRNPKTEGIAPTKDIAPLLKGWDYEAGTINVRKIRGADGQFKLQMRLDLGLLQMELDGRPDGSKPHGFDSLLEYFEAELKDHAARNGTELGFHLTHDQCRSLREEAYMYYQRYISLFVLEDYQGVLRDTARNLRVLDLCGKYAVDEQDRLFLEQYRPYITMMNTRAAASLLVEEKKLREAHEALQQGIEQIREFFVRFGQPEAFAESNEARVLRRMAREVRKKLPVDPIQRLQNRLDKAVKVEDYEEAARLRDEISRRKARPSA
jgi:hypothetical protein